MDITKSCNLPSVANGVLTVPVINSSESAVEMEKILADLGVVEKVIHLSKTAHVSGSSSNKLLKHHFRHNLDTEIDITDESITNLFIFMTRRSDMLRSAIARTSEDSGFDKSIDTGLLTAYEDISVEYVRLSERLASMKIDDPQRVSVSKEMRYLRKEMLEFKEMIAPAVQKLDVDAKHSQVNATNEALTAAVRLLG